jgi:hypothetical protein
MQGIFSFTARSAVAHRLVDAEALDAGHRGDGRALVVAVDHEQRPDQIIRGENILPHQPARPLRLAVAARAHDQIKGRGQRGVAPRAVAHLDRTSEFDRHVIATPRKRPSLTLRNSSTLARSRHRAPDPPQAQLILPGQQVMTRLMNNSSTMSRNPHV